MTSPRVRTVRGQDLDFTRVRSRSPVAASLKRVEAPFGGVKVLPGSPTRTNAFNRTPKSMENPRPLTGPTVRISPALHLSRQSIDSPTACGTGQMIRKSSIMQNGFSKSQQHQNYQDYLRKQREEHVIDKSIL